MRNLILALCLAVALQGCVAGSYLNCPQAAAGSFILVSDLDDTVKVTNVPSFFAKLKNGLSGKLVFAGMPELYQELLGQDASERLEFVSGAPALLRKKVTRTLGGAGFSFCQLALRPNPMKDIGQFKSGYLDSMHGRAEENGFILIGDDTEKDPEVYRDFMQDRGVLAVYIHRITGRSFDYDQYHMKVFVTAYDIAMYENREHRLSPEQAAAVGEAVLTAPDAVFFPDFQQCPEESMQIPDLPERLEQLKQLIERRRQNLCSKRRPTP